MNNKKEAQKVEEKTIFALSTITHDLPKFHYDEDGKCINPDFNNRLYVKKAYKAYLKGQKYFKYKDDIYTVPRISKQALDKYLDSVTLEELESLDILQELDNIENNSK